MTDIHELLARTRKRTLFKPGEFRGVALQFVGSPFAHLGRGPSFDCVGIGWKIFQAFGLDLGGEDFFQYPYNVKLWKSELLLEGLEKRFTMRGVIGPTLMESDVLGFRMPIGKVCHTGWYLGGGEFIHAEEGHGVHVSKLSAPRWSKRLTHCGRLKTTLFK